LHSLQYLNPQMRYAHDQCEHGDIEALSMLPNRPSTRPDGVSPSGGIDVLPGPTKDEATL
jgi:hypothetical protein